MATADKAFLSSHDEILESSRAARNPLLVALQREEQLSVQQISWSLDASYVKETLPSMAVVSAVMVLQGKVNQGLYSYWIASGKCMNQYEFSVAKQWLIRKLQRDVGREKREVVKELINRIIVTLGSL